jgi:hypothetical protein
MLPGNDEIMYRYARNRSKEIQADVASSRGEPFRPHVLRRRLAVIVGVGLVGLTLVVLTLALGWWML